MLWIPISGESMWPALRTGDRGRIEPLRGPLAPGTVVAVRMGNQIIAHRVVHADEAEVVMQGDNCAMPDPPVSPSKILGAISLVQRRGRTLSKAQWDRQPTLRDRVERQLRRGARFLRAALA